MAPDLSDDAPASHRPLPEVALRDRLADLVALAAGRPVLVLGAAVGLLAALLVLGPLVRDVASEPTVAPVEAALPLAGTSETTADVAGAAPGAAAQGVPGGEPGDVVVHAAGAVAEPGVYDLPSGSRVDDLVAAAGGLAPDADGDRVNLALPLADGERVYVPRQGEDDLPEAPSPAGSGEAGGSEPALVDLNAATTAELEALPGVGPVTAQAIVDHRDDVGPFAAVEDLLDVPGIGEARLAQLRDLVRV